MSANLSDEILSDAVAVSVARLMAAANRRARELGVDASQCVISISQGVRDGSANWRVNYGPRDYAGRRGGDLIIDVNPDDGSIANVMRGQ